MASEQLQSREERVKQILAETHALVTDSHIVYTAGNHGTAYINKDAVYPHTLKSLELGQMIAQDYLDKEIEVVVGPAYGGIILAHDTAMAMSQITGRDVLGVYAEKDGTDGFKFTRGYGGLVVGRRTLVVEDVLTSGKSAKIVVELCRQTGASSINLAVLANRGGVTPEDVGNVPFTALLNIHMEDWPEADCNLCATNVPINIEVGKGADFKKRKGLS